MLETTTYGPRAIAFIFTSRQTVILRSGATKNLVPQYKNEILRSLRSLRMTNSQAARINALALPMAPSTRLHLARTFYGALQKVLGLPVAAPLEAVPILADFPRLQ